MFQSWLLKMEDDQISDLSDWDQADLTTDDSYYVPSAKEESDEEEENQGRRRSKRKKKKTERWLLRRKEAGKGVVIGVGGVEIDEHGDEEAGQESVNVEEEEETEEGVDEGGDKGSVNAEFSERDKATLAELDYDDEDVEDFLRRAQNANTRSQTEMVVDKYNRVISTVLEMEGNVLKALDEMDRQDLPRLLARFFKLMRTKKGEVYNASSYTTFLNGFGRYLMDIFEPPIDVAKDPSFAVVRKVVKAMRAKAQATQGKKAGDNKSKV